MTKIFILHGWTYSFDTWRQLLVELRARRIDAELLAIPGLTDPAITPPAGGWTLDDYVEWLKQKTAGHEKVVLIGHSNGGRISIAFAARYPEKVERLILEDSAGIPPRGLRALKRDVFKAIAKAGHTVIRSESMRDLLYKIARESDYRKATPEMRRTMANLLSVDLSHVLDRVRAPTLIIWGEYDTTTPLQNGKILQEGIRQSRLVVIRGSRHSPHITHTKEVADLIAKELQQT